MRGWTWTGAGSAGRAGAGASAGWASSQRGVPSTSGKRITWPVPRLALAQAAAGAASPSQAADAVPARPYSGRSALASVSLHLARSTNIDSRFSVGASRSALQAR